MIQVTKVWWDGEKLMAEPIDPAAVYKEPERKWIGLTHEDKVRILANDFGGNRLDCMDAAERTLREKNQ